MAAHMGVVATCRTNQSSGRIEQCQHERQHDQSFLLFFQGHFSSVCNEKHLPPRMLRCEFLIKNVVWRPSRAVAYASTDEESSNMNTRTADQPSSVNIPPTSVVPDETR